MIQFNIRRLLLLLTCHIAIITNAAEPGQTTINIRVHNYTGSSISLYKVENGEAKRLSFRWPSNDTCIFELPVENEGVYYLGKTGKGNQLNYVLYLKPGEIKSVDFYSSRNGSDFDSCRIAKPNAETLLLQEWVDLFNNYCKLGENRNNRDQFIAAYSNFVKQAEGLKKKAVTRNKYFNHLFTSKIETEVKYPRIAAFFNFGERMNAVYDTIANHNEFYQSLNNESYCNPGLLYSEHGLQLLNYHLTFTLYKRTGNKELALATTFTEKVNLLCNDSLRRAYLITHMPALLSYEQFQSEVQPYKKLFNTPALELIYQAKKDELTIYAKGAPAYNFSLTDTRDKTVSLSDFKGKVVVLDIWAMWCAPCLNEKPFFQKTEEEFRDRDDIVFIGVSHDGLVKKEAWKKFVEKKGWKGVELIANWDESIGKYYNVTGIPRLMIFDKNGKIVTVDAPRPSKPEFKKLIEQTLKSNS